MSDLKAAQRFNRGDRVCCRAPWQQSWRIGIITDVFVAPITGKVVYVIGGEGYYSEDVTDNLDDLGPLPEPQSLRVAT